MSQKNKFTFVLVLFFLLIVLLGCTNAATPEQTSQAPTAALPAPISTSIPSPTTAPTPTSVFPVGTNGQPWWNDTVFYEIFVRSFYDGNGDGKGDFPGLTARLDYLASLGIKGIWLMPIHPSPSYHGYDVTDYYGVNPDYGSLDEFKTFLTEAHKRGIRVLLDFVLNHTSSQHPWFIKSEDPTNSSRNWYVWTNTDPQNPLHWEYVAGSGYYYHYFVPGMPDLNYKNPDVTREMENVAKFWLDLGVDGYRLDGAKYLIEEGDKLESTQSTHDWYKAFRPFYKAINSQALTVGEITSDSYTVSTYLKGDQLDLAFDFDLAKTWVSSIISGNGAKLRNSTSFEMDIYKNGQVATFLTNHDQDRIMSQLGRDVKKAKAAATVMLTAPGVPFIYYGEEIGLVGKKPDEAIRTPMQWTSDPVTGGFTTGTPWEALADNDPGVDVASEEKDPGSLLNHYRALIKIRNEHPALRIGDLFKVDASSDAVYASLRAIESDAILTIINLTGDPITDLKLNVSGSNLKGEYKLKALLGDGTFATLTVSDSGDITDYAPLASLPANANLVLLLTR